MLRKKEYVCLALVAATVCVAVTRIFTMPRRIVIHWNFDGVPDKYSDKTFILIMPVISALTWIFLRLCEKHPRMYNFPFKVTDEMSAGKIMNKFMYWVRLILLSMILYLTVCMAGMIHLSDPCMYSATATLLLLIVVATVKVYRNEKRQI